MMASEIGCAVPLNITDIDITGQLSSKTTPNAFAHLQVARFCSFKAFFKAKGPKAEVGFGVT